MPVSVPPKRVNWTGTRPSESLTQISLLPERLERNAMRDPSGEYCGLESYWVEETIFLGSAASGQVEAPDVGVLEELGVRHLVAVAGERRIGGVLADHRKREPACPPETGAVHNAWLPRRLEENRIERPSGAQVSDSR